MANTKAEAVDFELDDDNLMDKNRDAAVSPRVPIPKLMCTITGGSSSFSAPKKTKGRGFCEEAIAVQANRNARMSAHFDTLDFGGSGLGPKRC